MSVYSTATIIRRLQKHQPKTAQEILDRCDLPLVRIGTGLFRDVYLILGTQLVVKIPRKVPRKVKYQLNIQHAIDEFIIWRRMKTSRRKYNAFKNYLPNLVYFNHYTGITVMQEYKKVPRSNTNTKLLLELEKRITKVMGTEEADMHYDNLGLDKDGNIKITDMGLFIAGKV